jgi:ArsR family transcriptional regulator, virulence genes transcriptional regulator
MVFPALTFMRKNHRTSVKKTNSAIKIFQFYIIMEKNILDGYTENHKIDFKQIEEHLSKLKVLMHPVRFAIMVLLVKNKKMPVTDIYKALSIQQAAVSNHLKLMKTNNILSAERDGQNIFYSVNDKMLKSLFECLKLGFNDEY